MPEYLIRWRRLAQEIVIEAEGLWQAREAVRERIEEMGKGWTWQARCKGTTGRGEPCSRFTSYPSGLCLQHEQKAFREQVNQREDG